MKKAGAERVSNDAKKEMSKVLEKHVEEVTKQAKKYASMAGRKTVKAEDVKLAVKE